MDLFRRGLLEGRSIALAGAVPDAVKELLEALGAGVTGELTAPLDALVVADLGDIEEELLAETWTVVQAVATDVFIPAKSGRIVLLAPRGEVATAALENLARTLSVEWARHGITTTAIAPGPHTSEDQLATLVAYLCSPAGGYFSGCRLDMG